MWIDQLHYPPCKLLRGAHAPQGHGRDQVFVHFVDIITEGVKNRGSSRAGRNSIHADTIHGEFRRQAARQVFYCCLGHRVQRILHSYPRANGGTQVDDCGCRGTPQGGERRLDQKENAAYIGCYLLIKLGQRELDRKSTRLNSSHQIISYAVFCLKKKITPSLLVTATEPSHRST